MITKDTIIVWNTPPSKPSINPLLGKPLPGDEEQKRKERTNHPAGRLQNSANRRDNGCQQTDSSFSSTLSLSILKPGTQQVGQTEPKNEADAVC